MNIQMLTLEGHFALLEPLNQAHGEGFLGAGAEWGFTPDFVQEGIAISLRRQDEGTALPFATVDKLSGRVAGGTSFLQIDVKNRHLEVGSTWLGQPWRRTALNTEAKLLMLSHAFEAMRCVRVEFQADAENEQSRAALRRIGAYEEGTLRSYVLGPDGHPRQIVIYSIIYSEWETVKVRLRSLLDRRA